MAYTSAFGLPKGWNEFQPFRLVAGAGFEPTTSRLCIPLRLSPPSIILGPKGPNQCLWSGLSLHPAIALIRSQASNQFNREGPAIKSLHLPELESLATPNLRLGSGSPSLKGSPNLTSIHTDVSICAAHSSISCQQFRYAAERALL